MRLRRLPIGRAWEALREDEIACRALGINTTTTKLTAFAMGAMFGGFAGAFFATRQGFISPESFTFSESAMVLAIVVLGGMGSQLGVAVAATVMLGGFELFREFDQYRMLVFGAAMVAIDDLPAARPGFDPHAVGLPARAQGRPGQSSCAEARYGEPGVTAAPLLTVEHLTMRFGGLLAVNDLSFTARAARDHRADRAERRRQDHAVQLHHRLLSADGRPVAARPPGRRFVSARAACRAFASPRRRAWRARSRTCGCSPA